MPEVSHVEKDEVPVADKMVKFLPLYSKTDTLHETKRGSALALRKPSNTVCLLTHNHNKTMKLNNNGQQETQKVLAGTHNKSESFTRKSARINSAKVQNMMRPELNDFRAAQRSIVEYPQSNKNMYMKTLNINKSIQEMNMEMSKFKPSRYSKSSSTFQHEKSRNISRESQKSAEPQFNRIVLASDLAQGNHATLNRAKTSRAFKRRKSKSKKSQNSKQDQLSKIYTDGSLEHFAFIRSMRLSQLNKTISQHSKHKYY